jgi:phosphoribosylanthranilate isomerase
VEKAIRDVQPYAVDVCSGVESSPGIKDANKMQLFMEALNRANAIKNR